MERQRNEKKVRACHQLKDFVAKMVDFENRIAEYKEVFEKRKHRKPPFADYLKTIIDDTSWTKEG